jgi:hypothetical protein
MGGLLPSCRRCLASIYSVFTFLATVERLVQHRLSILQCKLRCFLDDLPLRCHDSSVTAKTDPFLHIDLAAKPSCGSWTQPCLAVPASTGTYKHHQPPRVPCVASRLLLACPCHRVAWCWAVADRWPARHSLNRPIVPARRVAHLATAHFVRPERLRHAD